MKVLLILALTVCSAPLLADVPVPKAPIPKDTVPDDRPPKAPTPEEIELQKTYQRHLEELEKYINSQRVRSWFKEERNMDLVATIKSWRAFNPDMSSTQLAMGLALLEKHPSLNIMAPQLTRSAAIVAKSGRNQRTDALPGDQTITFVHMRISVDKSLISMARHCVSQMKNQLEENSTAEFGADLSLINSEYAYCAIGYKTSGR